MLKMLKDKVLSAVYIKINEDMSKVEHRPFKLDEKKDFCEFIKFPNGEYLRDRYNEFIPTLSDCVFKPQRKRRYIEFYDGIGEDELRNYLGSNLRVASVDDETISIAYDDFESFDELVTRIYIEVLKYARDCYRKEYLEEHTEVKIYDVKDFYGKWIEDFKPNQVKGIEQGDFIAVKVKYTDDSGFDIKVGWYDKSIKDNGYNVFVSNVDGEYKIVSWCPMPKIK